MTETGILPHQPTAGILLAGGRATRMGGGDKGFRTLGGTSILARVIATLRPQCDALIINANADPTRFSAYSLPVVCDDIDGFAGPLAGILAGLDFVAEHLPEIQFALSAATDTPFLPSDLVDRLQEIRLREAADLACASSGGSVHHVMALWPVAIRHDLRQALTQNDIRAVQRFTGRYKVAHADWPVTPFDPFFNANEPADLAEAERIFASTLERSR